MAGAAQTQLGIAQIQQNAFSQLANQAKWVMDGAAQAIRDKSDMWTSTVKSAQNFKQQQIDEHFRNEELKLDTQRLSLDANFKQLGLGMDERKLALDSRQVAVQEARLNADLERIQEGDKHKGYVIGLTKQAAAKENRVKIDQQAINNSIKIKQAAFDSLTPYQKQYGEGKVIKAELQSLNQRFDGLEKERVDNTLIFAEIDAVNAGAEPGTILPLPQRKSNNGISVDRFNPLGMPSGEDGIDPLNMLLPNANSQEKTEIIPGPVTGFSEPTAEQLEGLKQFENSLMMASGGGGADDDDLVMYPGSDEPEIEYPSRGEIIGGIFSIPADDKNFGMYVQEFIDGASPEDKKYITQDMRANAEKKFLMAYGTATKYNFQNSVSDSRDYFSKVTEDYQRTGGMPTDLIALEAQASDKLMEIRGELMSAKGEDGKSPLFPIMANGSGSDNLDLAVSQKYNEWIQTRSLAIDEAQAADKNTSVQKGIEVDGSLTFADANPDKPLQSSRVKKFWRENRSGVLSETARIANDEKKMMDDILEFRNEFIIKEGPDSGKIKNSFETFVRKNKDKVLADDPDYELASSMPKRTRGPFTSGTSSSRMKNAEEAALARIISSASSSVVAAHNLYKKIKGY